MAMTTVVEDMTANDRWEIDNGLKSKIAYLMERYEIERTQAVKWCVTDKMLSDAASMLAEIRSRHPTVHEEGQPKTIKTIDVLKSALSLCHRNGVEMVPFTEGENLPGTMRPGDVFVPPHKEDQGGLPAKNIWDMLVWTDRHTSATLVADMTPGPFQKQTDQLINEMRAYLKTLGRHPDDSAPMPLAHGGSCDMVPIKIDGYWCRAILSYSSIKQAMVFSLDCLFPERNPNCEDGPEPTKASD